MMKVRINNNMNLYSLLAGLIITFLLAVPLYAKQDNKSAPPGQEKKEAHVGNVESVTNNSIVVEEKHGKKTETVVDTKTKVVGAEKKLLRLRNIKIKDKVAVISSDSADVATDGAKKKKALKIFVKQLTGTESAQLKRRAVHGIIDSIVGNLITLVHQIHRDRIYNVLVNEQTLIKFKNQISSGSASLQVGQRIVAMGDPQADGSLLARRIHVIPGKAKGIFRRFPIATPSASPTATVSPTLTIEPTVTSTPSPTLSEPTPTPTP